MRMIFGMTPREIKWILSFVCARVCYDCDLPEKKKKDEMEGKKRRVFAWVLSAIIYTWWCSSTSLEVYVFWGLYCMRRDLASLRCVPDEIIGFLRLMSVNYIIACPCASVLFTFGLRNLTKIIIKCFRLITNYNGKTSA